MSPAKKSNFGGGSVEYGLLSPVFRVVYGQRSIARPLRCPAAKSANRQRMIVQLNQQTPVLHKKIIKNAEIHKKHTNMLDNAVLIAYNEKHNSKNHTILKGKNL